MVTASFVLVIMVTMFAWMVITLVTVCAMDSDRRPWLAAAVERYHRPLMDRLNTLVFLEHTRDKQSLAYVERNRETDAGGADPSIARSSLLSSSTLCGTPACSGVVLAVTILFYGCFRPWQYVAVAESDVDAPAENGGLLEIPPLEEEPQETLPGDALGGRQDQRAGKGPASDLARRRSLANRSERQPAPDKTWSGLPPSTEQTRSSTTLATPDDPRYAVYQPELSIRDFAAEPWDVVRYYARATTEDGATYESEVYFIEVVPVPGRSWSSCPVASKARGSRGSSNLRR